MEKLNQIINDVVEKTRPLLLDSMITNVVEESKQLIETINDNRFIKIPIVGDFNSGKTSLVNVILQEDGKLPVATTPETAIPCELRPVDEGTNPYVVVLREEDEIFKGSIDKYKSVTFLPGDYAILHTRSVLIKTWYDKGIILVDMPGASSGIKEHNEAILRYISQGTIYAFLIDSVNGAISESSMKFIKEIMQYGLNVRVFISRTDLCSPENLSEIQSLILEHVSSVLLDTKIGLISAERKEISDFCDFVEGIDANQITQSKFVPVVKKFIADQILVLNELKSASELTEDKDLEKRINEIQDQIDQINSALEESLSSVDSPEKSTQDILKAIKSAIREHAPAVADAFINSSEGSRLSVVNEALINILRPTLLESFKREQDEFITTLNTSISNLTARMLTTLQIPESLLEQLVKENQVMIIEGVRLLAERLMQANNPYVQILGQALNFFAEYVPDLVRQLVGNNHVDKIRTQMTERVSGQLCDSITNSLRTPIEQQVRLMQNQIIEATQKQYEQRISHFETILNDLKKQREDGMIQAKATCEKYLSVINELESINGELNERL